MHSGAESALPTRRSLEEAAREREERQKRGSPATSRGSCDLNEARRQATLLPSLVSVDLLANSVPVGVVVGRFGILGDQAIGAA